MGICAVVVVIAGVITASGRVTCSEGIGDAVVVGTDDLGTGLSQRIHGPLHLKKRQVQGRLLCREALAQENLREQRTERGKQRRQ